MHCDMGLALLLRRQNIWQPQGQSKSCSFGIYPALKAKLKVSGNVFYRHSLQQNTECEMVLSRTYSWWEEQSACLYSLSLPRQYTADKPYLCSQPKLNSPRCLLPPAHNILLSSGVLPFSRPTKKSLAESQAVPKRDKPFLSLEKEQELIYLNYWKCSLETNVSVLLASLRFLIIIKTTKPVMFPHTY